MRSSADDEAHRHVRSTDDKGLAAVQVDVYGVKVDITPSPARGEEPQNWTEVARAINLELMAIATNAVSLVADTLRAARSLIRGIGALPSSLRNRVEEAHDRAARVEDQSRRNVDSADVAAAMAKIQQLVKSKMVAGVDARVYVDSETDKVVFYFVGPTDDETATQVVRTALALTSVLDESDREK